MGKIMLWGHGTNLGDSEVGETMARPIRRTSRTEGIADWAKSIRLQHSVAEISSDKTDSKLTN